MKTKVIAFITALALLLVAGLSGHYQDVIASSYGTLDISSLIPGTGATNAGKAEDAASASGDTGIAMWAVRDDDNDTTTCADGDYSRISVNDVGNLKVQVEPTRKSTYAASSTFTTLAASATDFFTIYGSGTKTIKVHKIYVRNASTGTTGTTDRISLIKRSTAPTGGTATTLTNVPLDSGNAAGTATVKIWTANPTVGTAIGTLMTRQLDSQTTGDVRLTPGDVTVFQGGLYFDSAQFGQALTLRGTGEGIACSLGGVTQSGTSPTMCVDVVWTEEHPALVALALIGLFGAHSRRRREIDKLRRVA